MLISVVQPRHLAYDKQNSSAWATLLSLSTVITGFSISCASPQSVFDRRGHARGSFQRVYRQNETLKLSEVKLLSNNEISAGDQMTVAMGDPLCISALSPCVDPCVCVKWMIRCEDTKLCLHLSSSLDAALKVKGQTLEPGS